jgi:predicted DNA-binding antitoxin AbrB/MazE fold protein
MTITVDAVYENGVLKPKQPLTLVEGTLVRLSLSTLNEDDDPLEAVIGIGASGRTDGTGDEEDDPFEAVIGICDDGPDVSLAARHDEFIYGLKRAVETKP